VCAHYGTHFAAAAAFRCERLGLSIHPSLIPALPLIDSSGELRDVFATSTGGGNMIQRLCMEIIEALKQKDVTDRMLAEGTVPTPSSPEEFTSCIKQEIGNGVHPGPVAACDAIRGRGPGAV
jgi:hypothetical protein